MTQASLPADARAALRQLGQAWRGDWVRFDGRHLRDQLGEIEQIADGTLTLDQLRATWHLCPHGGGHWSEYCHTDCTEGER